MKNSYSLAVKELEKFHYMPEPGRMRTDELARALAARGNPQLAYGRAQVIGTNGKGAAAYFLARILEAHGVKTGLYTSPHLVSYCERIAAGGRRISETEFGALYFSLKPVFEKFRLTQFERLTLMAAEFFKTERVEFAVLETGLGGTGDAVTALAAPLLLYTAVTPEHRDLLGPSLRQIAGAKAGPLSAAETAFSCRQPFKCVAAMLRARARSGGASLEFCVPPAEITLRRRGVSFKFGRHAYRIAVFGAPAALNAGLALRAAAHILGARFRTAFARRALAGGVWEWRLQVVRYPGCNPLLVSCAHNDASLDADLAAIKEMAAAGILPGRMSVLFGVSGNRDSRRLLRKAAKAFDDITVTEVPGSAGAFEKMRGLARRLTGVRVVKDCRAATRLVVGPEPERKRFAAVIGSIYLAGAALSFAGGGAAGKD
ncbi:MAG: hypothetical protein PHW69_05680 [Elusimicrobiaceae bacterium]|nr:hypothetical protein [Elusimicrobiaceae bacterium]